MISRDFRTILAGIFLVGFGFFSNYLTRIGAERLATLVSIAAVLAALYIAIDIIVATETSLLYRINRMWTEPNAYRVSAVLVVIGGLALVVFLIGKLVSP